MNGANACSPDQCVQDSSFCSTGQAGTQAASSWVCTLDFRPGALPAGNGVLCFNGPANCTNAVNFCNIDHPCQQAPSYCSTGLAGGFSDYNWVCSYDIPVGSLPNGGGQNCYTSQVRALLFPVFAFPLRPACTDVPATRRRAATPGLTRAARAHPASSRRTCARRVRLAAQRRCPSSCMRLP